MPRVLAPELPSGCPWSGWTPPNVNWCEQELCAWVTNPANTWSNAAYVLFGLWMWREARKRGRPELQVFGPASIVVGIFSGVYHASYTWFFQFFDFLGMFVFALLPITLNARRLSWIGPRGQLPAYVAGVAVMSALTPVGFESGFPIQSLVFLLMVVTFLQEVALRARGSGAVDYRPYWATLALLGAAGLCSALDVTRVWCDPTNHWIQGHAAWHLLSAASLVALYRFYAGLTPQGRTA